MVFKIFIFQQLYLGSQWTAYGGLESNPVLTSPTFFEIASHYEFVIAQVILRLYKLHCATLFRTVACNSHKLCLLAFIHLCITNI